ncbi:hypothetical protein R3W88_024867 [Solanum pinnatisectum]|uniref:F-box domain-containing protein n=1 Tax=Solanum pinnatisectum TaxID=50273 RepID=A0AAV9M3K8_9SOLN|nr:hypothetical protein R3W88_024867 [Solanum pinnatisectum]
MTMAADILPECLIQKILSFLSFKEATKMSIVSKTWMQAWSTLSNLKFIVHRRKGDIQIVDTIMERYRDGEVLIEKFELSKLFGDSHPVFPLVDKWLDIALQNGVKDLILNYTSYPTPIFAILRAKSLRKLILKSCPLLPLSLTNGVVNSKSLRKLSLSYVKLDEIMLQTLLNSFPSIVSFMFEYCSGLETIELVNLQKIKSVSLKVLRIWDSGGIWEIDAPNLVSFEYMGKLIPQLRIARQLEHSNVILYGLDNVNTDWFYKLRKFLSSSNSWFKVTLYIFEYTEIKMEHLLQQHHRVATHQVDILEVNRQGQNRECSSFVDALVWSCLPRRLSLQRTPEMFTIYIDRLMHMKKTIQSTSHGSSNPWYSQLKDVKAYKSDWKMESWYPVEHKSEELTAMNLDTYSILLDW